LAERIRGQGKAGKGKVREGGGRRRPAAGGVEASQVKYQLVVDEDPHVVIA